jgi:hypothetical protein
MRALEASFEGQWVLSWDAARFYSFEEAADDARTRSSTEADSRASREGGRGDGRRLDHGCNVER